MSLSVIAGWVFDQTNGGANLGFNRAAIKAQPGTLVPPTTWVGTLGDLANPQEAVVSGWTLTAGVLTNSADIEWTDLPSCTVERLALGVGTATGVGAYEVELDTPTAVLAGDTFRIPAGDLEWRCTGAGTLEVDPYARDAVLNFLGGLAALPATNPGDARWGALFDDTDTELTGPPYERQERDGNPEVFDVQAQTVRAYALMETEAGANRLLRSPLAADKVYPGDGTLTATTSGQSVTLVD